MKYIWWNESNWNRHCWQRSFPSYLSNPPPDVYLIGKICISPLLLANRNDCIERTTELSRVNGINFSELLGKLSGSQGPPLNWTWMPPRHCENEYRSRTCNKAWMQSSAETTDSCWTHLGLWHALPPVHVLYKFSYQHILGKKMRFQIRWIKNSLCFSTNKGNWVTSPS